MRRRRIGEDVDEVEEKEEKKNQKIGRKTREEVEEEKNQRTYLWCLSRRITKAIAPLPILAYMLMPKLDDMLEDALSSRFCFGLEWMKLTKLFVSVSRDFRHEKTKKKRGSYRGGQIDLQSHSVKFNYDDDD
ncbi:unnamed protein product [Ilex paraguariensis]|uniref:Srp40 C-terminal domain-containing protein n=1 Tax=Ilex paraguariensis TaxID=185542 RepID=A0ABC8RGY1_9AQUA